MGCAFFSYKIKPRKKEKLAETLQALFSSKNNVQILALISLLKKHLAKFCPEKEKMSRNETEKGLLK